MSRAVLHTAGLIPSSTSDEKSLPPQLNSKSSELRINTPKPAVGCSGGEQAGLDPPDHTRHGCPWSLARPWERAQRESVSCPAGRTLSAPAPPREGPLTMCWPRLMDRRVHDSLFLVTHGFAGLRQCHGKYFFNNSKCGGGSGKQKEKLHHIVFQSC